eukprot:CAMPEP_0173428032 /NCGR_PEP_ID=MMETSP1357-20121228/7085_1 /TAXON_ID=77926 /ORGANISM="Hemiselmis rufescens, Strain PCC563" /LENGTH=221 /DNA_ID=CAMNT_0014391981 /DNA_START=141 /DNA_END=807 /DNA_ORIENTATION=+
MTPWYLAVDVKLFGHDLHAEQREEHLLEDDVELRPRLGLAPRPQRRLQGPERAPVAEDAPPREAHLVNVPDALEGLRHIEHHGAQLAAGASGGVGVDEAVGAVKVGKRGAQQRVCGLLRGVQGAQRVELPLDLCPLLRAAPHAVLGPRQRCLDKRSLGRKPVAAALLRTLAALLKLHVHTRKRPLWGRGRAGPPHASCCMPRWLTSGSAAKGACWPNRRSK